MLRNKIYLPVREKATFSLTMIMFIKRRALLAFIIRISASIKSEYVFFCYFVDDKLIL